MTFTKSDLITLGMGAAITVLLVLGESLVALDPEVATDWGAWGNGLLVGTLTGLGRYLLTRVPEFWAKS